jgi:tetratricopeptide (TPR) repeat protein
VYRSLDYARRGYDELALADANKAIELRPTDDSYESRGDAYLALSEYDLAIADYQRALELDPYNGSAYLGLALAYYRTDDCSRAMEACTRGLDICAERCFMGMHRRFEVLKHLCEARYAEAVTELDALLVRRPFWATGYSLRGNAHYALEDTTRAIKDWREAHSINVNHPHSAKARRLIGLNPLP